MAQTAIWTKRYPDFVMVVGAQEAPVGLAASSTGTYVAGTHYLSGNSSYFSLARHEQGGGTIVQELLWPTSSQTGIRTATCSAMIPGEPPNSAAMDCVVAGTVVNSKGNLRPALAKISANDSGTTPVMNLAWATTHNLSLDFDQVPLAITADANTAAFISKANYAGLGQGWIAQMVAYDMTLGGEITTEKFDTTGDDIPNAVGLISTKDGGRAAVILVTTPSLTTPGKTQLAVVGWMVIPGTVKVGRQLGPLYLPQGPSESDEGVAVATMSISSVDPSELYGCGTRTKAAGAAAKDFLTFKVHTARPASGNPDQADDLILDWIHPYDNLNHVGEDTDIAKSICVYERTPQENQIHGATRIAVTGTSNSNPSSVATIVYNDGGFGRWYADWNDAGTSGVYAGNHAPTAMSAGRINHPTLGVIERLYISGYAEKTFNNLQNRDFACTSYNTAIEGQPGQAILKQVEWSNFYHAWTGNDDGRDEARFIHTRNVGAQIDQGALFMSGVSASSLTADDWVTLRIYP